MMNTKAFRKGNSGLEEIRGAALGGFKGLT